MTKTLDLGTESQGREKYWVTRAIANQNYFMFNV